MMRTLMLNRSLAVLAFLGLCWSGAAQADSSLQKVSLASEVELAAGEKKQFDFEVRKSLGEGESKLTFVSWIKAPSVMGYSGALKIYLDGVELTVFDERGTTFATLSGTSTPTYTPTGGWVLVYAKNPDQWKDLPEDNAYRVQEPQDFDITKFVFQLPELKKGKHTITFEVPSAELAMPVIIDQPEWSEVE